LRTGIFITARLGSTRLEKKHLLPVNGHPLLYFLISRIVREFEKEINTNEICIVIVTSDEPDNRRFEDLSNSGATVFYGSPNNIPLRHLQAAKAHMLDAVVAVDGDDILCSTRGMRAVYDALIKGASYIKTSNLPFGMNSAGYTLGFVESALNGHHEESLETGWGRIFGTENMLDIHIPFPVTDNALRFTLDYDEDYRFFKTLIEALGDRVFTACDEEIIGLVMDKGLYTINEPIAKQYWENFYEEQEREIRRSKDKF